jgi:acetyl-CoA synthetase
MSNSKSTTKELHGEFYTPAPEFVAQANVPDPEAAYKEAADDLEGYWARRARELEWYQPWEKVLDDSQKPFYKWFVGGKTNIVLNAIDRHVRTWRRNKLALIWEGENGEVRTFSYHALNRELCKFSIVLRSMGIGKGDRVTIYMPRIPETWIAILACEW